MTVKTIKGINEQIWTEFKILAAKNNIKMGNLFTMMVKQFENKSKKFWDEILSGKKVLSDDEAKIMEETITSSRKEYGFRL